MDAQDKALKMAWGKRAKKDEPLAYSSLDELLALLAEERKKTLKRRRIAKIFLSLYLSLFVVMLIGAVLRQFHGIGGIFNGFGSFTGMIAGMYAATNTQKKGVQALAEFDDLRAAPRLIEMLEYNDNSLKADAATLLEKLLPKLQASDAPMLTPEHHAILNRVLMGKVIAFAPNPTIRLLTAILTALQQVGTESSLPVVIELAEGKGRAKQFSQVGEAARECLPFLQQRAENQRQTQTLLRASDGNRTPADMLLRPALESPSTIPADELLRAAPETNALPLPTVSTASAFNPALNPTPHLEPEAQQEVQIARLS